MREEEPSSLNVERCIFSEELSKVAIHGVVEERVLVGAILPKSTHHGDVLVAHIPHHADFVLHFFLHGSRLYCQGDMVTYEKCIHLLKSVDLLAGLVHDKFDRADGSLTESISDAVAVDVPQRRLLRLGLGLTSGAHVEFVRLAWIELLDGG